MAAAMEKVLNAVGVNQHQAFSKEFFEFVKSIGESRSKQVRTQWLGGRRRAPCHGKQLTGDWCVCSVSV